MKRVESTDPGVLELRSEVQGCLVLFGLPFFAVGLLALLGAVGVLPIELPKMAPERLILAAFGAVVALVGLVTMGGRRGKILDRRQDSIVSWWGLFVPLRRTSQALRSYSRVTLEKEVRRSGGENKSKRTYYPVSLEGGGGATFDVDTFTDYQEARRLAEDMARFLHWALADSSSGEMVVREAEHLDESVRDRLRRTGERVELPAAPSTMRSQVRAEFSQVTAEIPPSGPPISLYIQVGATVLMAVVAAVIFGGVLLSAPMPNPVRYGILAFLGFFFVLLPMVTVLPKLRGARQGTRITATQNALRVEWGKKVVEIPAHELEELSLAGKDMDELLQTQPDGSLVVNATAIQGLQPSNLSPQGGRAPVIPSQAAGLVRALASLAPDRLAIVARSDRETVSFGAGLGADELAYLWASIMKVMAE